MGKRSRGIENPLRIELCCLSGFTPSRGWTLPFFYHLILGFFWLECGPWGHCPFPFPPLPSAEVQASLKGLGLHLGRRERGEGEGAMMLVLHRMLHSGTGGTLGPTVGLHSTLLVQMGFGPWGPWAPPLDGATAPWGSQN